MKTKKNKATEMSDKEVMAYLIAHQSTMSTKAIACTCGRSTAQIMAMYNDYVAALPKTSDEEIARRCEILTKRSKESRERRKARKNDRNIYQGQS